MKFVQILIFVVLASAEVAKHDHHSKKKETRWKCVALDKARKNRKN